MGNGEQAIARDEGDGGCSFGAGECGGLHDNATEGDGGERCEALCLLQERVEEGVIVDADGVIGDRLQELGRVRGVVSELKEEMGEVLRGVRENV